ncbi:LOW QUALITY PROTEIN: hypothetical protein IFM46972_01818 [Aspergillus udagawae]|uniref:Uncharacterized protein n=1 Tax=Aspergillus udagawae TaxID=91492 RepID=A0A8H3N9R3_9EURO|nr:LOW QUALITY PROTEIN: hypothetical protein IFM46972_01818 [Aspergillus udagawae]
MISTSWDSLTDEDASSHGVLFPDWIAVQTASRRSGNCNPNSDGLILEDLKSAAEAMSKPGENKATHSE